jgi:phage shock protein A
MENVRQGRDDLAREALTRGQECSEAADVAAAEADALDAVRDAYRNALTAVRATVADRASA